ncbi:MAG: sigma-70 family RNA polymerase sigma factor [Angustibacter sp.]
MAIRPEDSTDRDHRVADHRVDVETLIRDHMPLARSLAFRYRDRGENLDDLIQVAYVGLVKAAQSYREGVGANFEAFAVPTMTGELRRYFRDRGWDVRPPRRLQELRLRIRRAEEVLSHQLRRLPSTAEIATYLEVPPAEVDEARAASQAYSAVSLDAPPPGFDDADWSGADSVADLVLADGARSSCTSAFESAGEEQVTIDVAIRPLLAQLDEREQLILALRFYGGYTQQQIAQRIGVTQMQVSRLLSQVLRRLRAAVEADPTPQTVSDEKHPSHR